jgi:hypothetical protein
MVLLSNMMRAEAITGRTGYVDQWLAGRQFGRWVYQPASPAAPPPPTADPAESLKTLSELHEQGVVSDAEFEALRSRIKAG